MSETIFTSETNGDWGTAAIWSTDVVPDSDVANVTIAADVTISSSESFTAGTLTVTALGLLDLDGSLDVAAGATVNGGVPSTAERWTLARG